MPRVRQTKKIVKREGRPNEAALRWNIHQAAREFGIHREQLERRRRALGIEPDIKGNFTTKQIAAMVFGDKEAETIGKIAAERRKLEIECSRLEGELIPTATVIKLVSSFFIPIRQKICASDLGEDEKHDLLSDLVRCGELDWAKEAANAERNRNRR